MNDATRKCMNDALSDQKTIDQLSSTGKAAQLKGEALERRWK